MGYREGAKFKESEKCHNSVTIGLFADENFGNAVYALRVIRIKRFELRLELIYYSNTETTNYRGLKKHQPWSPDIPSTHYSDNCIAVNETFSVFSSFPASFNALIVHNKVSNRVSFFLPGACACAMSRHKAIFL